VAVRLLDLDLAVWARIANDLQDLAGEIAVDDDEPLDQIADNDAEWPTDSLAVEIHTLIVRAEMLAIFAVGAGNPRLTMDELRRTIGFATKGNT
jgi:asparagine synthetase A